MTRHSIDPEDTDGGTSTAAIEKEALRMPEEIPFSDFLGRLSIASHRAEQAEKNAEHYRTLAKKAEARADKAESKLGEAVRLECPDPDAHWRLDEAQETIQRLTQERDEPPARPEGAEEIERLIETSPWHLAGSCSAEADWMAERGVRVVGGEDPR